METRNHLVGSARRNNSTLVAATWLRGRPTRRPTAGDLSPRRDPSLERRLNSTLPGFGRLAGGREERRADDGRPSPMPRRAKQVCRDWQATDVMACSVAVHRLVTRGHSLAATWSASYNDHTDHRARSPCTILRSNLILRG